MRRLIVGLLAALAPLLTAATESHALADGLRRLRALDARVAAVAYRIASANRELCSEQAPLPGIVLHSAAQYGRKARAAARAAFDLGDAPSINVVVPGSPADRAGLRSDDRLVAVNGIAFPPSPVDDGEARFDPLPAAMIGEALGRGPAAIDIERAGTPMTVTLTAGNGCAGEVQLIPSASTDAGADGHYVHVTSAIVEYVERDDELAVVIAHEMAHNILRHRQWLDAQNVDRGLLRIFGRNASRIRQTETEADRFGLYLLARAGYDIEAAPAFWERFGRDHGYGIFSEPTHPRGGTRAARLREVIAEIRARQAAGAPLLPDLSDGK